MKLTTFSSAQDVARFLEESGYGAYANCFFSHRIDGQSVEMLLSSFKNIAAVVGGDVPIALQIGASLRAAYNSGEQQSNYSNGGTSQQPQQSSSSSSSTATRGSSRGSSRVSTPNTTPTALSLKPISIDAAALSHSRSSNSSNVNSTTQQQTPQSSVNVVPSIERKLFAHAAATAGGVVAVSRLPPNAYCPPPPHPLHRHSLARFTPTAVSPNSTTANTSSTTSTAIAIRPHTTLASASTILPHHFNFGPPPADIFEFPYDSDSLFGCSEDDKNKDSDWRPDDEDNGDYGKSKKKRGKKKRSRGKPKNTVGLTNASSTTTTPAGVSMLSAFSSAALAPSKKRKDAHTLGHVAISKAPKKNRKKTKKSGKKGGEFPCQLCPHISPTQSGLNCHMVVHSTERPFECDFCDRNFKTKANLKRHNRIHTNAVRPFSCVMCNISFRNNDQLKRHLKIHFKDSTVDELTNTNDDETDIDTNTTKNGETIANIANIPNIQSNTNHTIAMGTNINGNINSIDTVISDGNLNSGNGSNNSIDSIIDTNDATTIDTAMDTSADTTVDSVIGTIGSSQPTPSVVFSSAPVVFSAAPVAVATTMLPLPLPSTVMNTNTAVLNTAVLNTAVLNTAVMNTNATVVAVAVNDNSNADVIDNNNDTSNIDTRMVM